MDVVGYGLDVFTAHGVIPPGLAVALLLALSLIVVGLVELMQGWLLAFRPDWVASPPRWWRVSIRTGATLLGWALAVLALAGLAPPEHPTWVWALTWGTPIGFAVGLFAWLVLYELLRRVGVKPEDWRASGA